MSLDTDEIGSISGIDNVNLQPITNANNNIDYSNIEDLRKISELPNVNINNINGESCSNNGQYIIYGEISDISKVEEKYSNINLLLSSTKSIGLCEVNINKDDKNITIICQNSDKFEMSQIRIEKSLIQDSEGNNIFQIKSYSSPEQFSCDISLNSVKITTQGNNATEPETQVETEREQEPEPKPDPEQTKKGYSSRFWRTNSGLSGGTIVAIIIPLVVVIIALIIVFVLMKKGILSKKDKNIKDANDSTIRKLNIISS
jgi:hypothetical protein